jgi:hypothetical protein
VSVPSLWVAKLIISPATATKLSSLHGLDAEDVKNAILCVPGLTYAWEDDPERGRRAIVDINVGRSRVEAVLYPVDDPLGDSYALGSAYVR